VLIYLLGFEQDLIHAIFKLVWRRRRQRGHRRRGDSFSDLFSFFFLTAHFPLGGVWFEELKFNKRDTFVLFDKKFSIFIN
jgi:hypothetical protein